MRRAGWLLVFVGVFLVFGTVSLQPVFPATAFYEGKAIQLVVGFSPGGGFDLVSRLVARHMRQYIPGRPTIIVQNQPGAGSLIAANRVYAMQPGDGLTLVNFHFGMVGLAVIGDPAVQFDPRKWLWLGDPSPTGPGVVLLRSDLPIRTLEDWRKSSQPLAFGTTNPGSTTHDRAEFLKSVRLPVRVVSGYRGSSDIMSALHRKELDAVAITIDTVESNYPHLLTENIVRPILVFHTDSQHPALPNVPTLARLELTPEQRAVAEFLLSVDELLRVYAIPPGAPPDRLNILQQAFRQTLTDHRFVEDAKRLKVKVAPVYGDQVSQLVERITKTSRETIDGYAKLIGRSRP